MLITSIDLMDGKAVQLKQGMEKVLEREDVLELAKYYGRFGELSVIDIDAAVGNGDNEKLIKQICKVASCRVGGGIRDVEKAKRIFSYGAKKIIIGTGASEELLSKLPKEKILIAIDVKDGVVATHGWTKFSNTEPLELVKRFNSLCSGFVYTNVENEGMMQGSDFEKVKEIRSVTTKEVVASGGISSIEEIVKLQKMNIYTQLGMSVYTGKIKLEDAFVACVDFERRFGFIPTVLQDVDTKQVLGVVYSTAESLKFSLTTGKGTYFNRDQKKLFVKGETSGNIQELVTARFNCDFDALFFMVKEKGNACHLGRYSCFGDKEFSIGDMYNKIVDDTRILPDDSLTTKMLKNDFLLKRQLMDAAFRIVNFDKAHGLEEETANFLQYLLILMAKNDITPQAVLNSLSVKK